MGITSKRINRIIDEIDRCAILSADPKTFLKAVQQHIDAQLLSLRNPGSTVCPPEVSRVIQVVSSIWGVDAAQLTSVTRKHPLAQARQVCHFLLVELLGSQTTTAKAWGCAHSNVNNSVHTISGHLTWDAKLRDKVKLARHRILGHE